MSVSNHDYQQDGVTREKCVTLVVVNTHQLGAGLSAKHTFYPEGGFIGARPEADWILQDNKEGVHSSHAHISMMDGHFCLTDISGACYINGATVPLGLGKSVKFNEKDTVEIGHYHLRVNFYTQDELHTGNWRGLSQAFASELEGIDLDGSDVAELDFYVNAQQGLVDPLAALDVLDAQQDTINGKLNTDKDNLNGLKNQETNSEVAVTVQADSEYEMGSAIVLKRTINREDHSMDENILDRLEEEMGRNFTQSLDALSHSSNQDHELAEFDHDLMQDRQHMVVAPLLRGLGVQIGDANNMAKMQALAEEMGSTLKSVVEGLLSLHQQVGESRFGVMNKNLQPIEDNPLRLGLSYQDTVQTLFDGQRSAVHLCAPAAVEETLRNVRNHNEAVQSATSFALNQILHAFSPEILIKRFSAYRRSGEDLPESKEAWAWKMYQSYYRELTSHRQKGFEKLFWEIFEQAYDSQIREKQREP